LIRGAPVLSPPILIAVVPGASHVKSGTKCLGVPASYIESRHCAESYKGKDCVSVHGGHLQTPSMDRHKRVETTAWRWLVGFGPMIQPARCQFEAVRPQRETLSSPPAVVRRAHEHQRRTFTSQRMRTHVRGPGFLDASTPHNYYSAQWRHLAKPLVWRS
jgi:hypothetical protein